MTPPERIAAIDENASAFMWLSGSGVMKRSTSGRTVASSPRPRYHSPARRK